MVWPGMLPADTPTASAAVQRYAQPAASSHEVIRTLAFDPSITCVTTLDVMAFKRRFPAPLRVLCRPSPLVPRAQWLQRLLQYDRSMLATWRPIIYRPDRDNVYVVQSINQLLRKVYELLPLLHYKRNRSAMRKSSTCVPITTVRQW